MANLRKIGADETFSTKQDVKGRKVSAVFAVSPSGDDKKAGLRFEVPSVLDFGGLTEAELVELASRPIIIDLQRKFRVKYAADPKAALDPATWAAVNVKTDVLEAARAPQDPKARVVSGFSKLDAKAKREMIALLEASLKQEGGRKTA